VPQTLRPPTSNAENFVSREISEMSRIAHEQNYRTADRWKYRLDQSNLTFVVWAPIILIVLMVASIVAGIELDPDLSSFLSP
jgi:hypothetical protein